MRLITCPLTFIPVRKEASHKSEQVTQLLFGETAHILENSKEWLYIKTNFDQYEGWVEKKVVSKIPSLTATDNVTVGFSRLVRLTGESLWLSSGSEIRTGMIDSQSATIVTINPELNKNSISEIALQFIGTPYLWGGRSFMGIDCSGFAQAVYKAMKIKLPRDASQQVNVGNVVQFPSDAIAGDLAFFDNDEGDITHVGIILEPGKIIHASGSVRIDKIDQQGIYNAEIGDYSHKLRLIKRVL